MSNISLIHSELTLAKLCVPTLREGVPLRGSKLRVASPRVAPMRLPLCDSAFKKVTNLCKAVLRMNFWRYLLFAQLGIALRAITNSKLTDLKRKQGLHYLKELLNCQYPKMKQLLKQ